MVTWDSFEANTDADQYVVYINRTTGRIDKVNYTIREFARFATGAIHYVDFRDVDGVLIPLRQYITSDVDDDYEDNIHLIEIDAETIRVDAVKAQELLVDPNLAVMGDEKPA